MTPRGLPTPISPRWADHPQKTILRADGVDERCIEVYCKQQKTSLPASSVQQITNKLIYQSTDPEYPVEDTLPDCRPDYILIPLDRIEENDDGRYVIKYKLRHPEDDEVGESGYAPRTPDKTGVGYVVKKNGDRSSIPRFVVEVQAERAYHIAELEELAEKEAQELKKIRRQEKVFFAALTLISLATLALVRPFTYAIGALLAHSTVFSLAWSAISHTVRQLFQRAIVQIAVFLVALWHKLEEWFLRLRITTVGLWRRLRNSWVAGLVTILASRIRLSLSWLFAQVFKVLRYGWYRRYSVLTAIVLASLYYFRGVYDGLLPSGSSFMPTSETPTFSTVIASATAMTRLPSRWRESPMRSWPTVTWAESKTFLGTLFDTFRNVALPPIMNFFDWTTLIALTACIVLVPGVKLGYNAIVDWLRRRDRQTPVIDSRIPRGVLHATMNSGAPGKTSPVVYKFLAGLVYMVEELKGRWVAAQTTAENACAGISRLLGDHFKKVAGLLIVALLTANVALGEKWTEYANIRYAIIAIILSAYCYPYFFAALGWLLRQVMVGAHTIWSLLKKPAPLITRCYHGLKDLVGAVAEVVWDFEWKVIIRVVLGQIYGTIWLASTICLGIWMFYELKGPLPVLDMMIKYSDGEEGPRVRVVQ